MFCKCFILHNHERSKARQLKTLEKKRKKVKKQRLGNIRLQHWPDTKRGQK